MRLPRATCLLRKIRKSDGDRNDNIYPLSPIICGNESRNPTAHNSTRDPGQPNGYLIETAINITTGLDARKTSFPLFCPRFTVTIRSELIGLEVS
jgi:hypothetical protein